MQPVVIAEDGVIRFKANKIVCTLLDTGKLTINDLVRMDFSEEDWTQFNQLIGYSIDGAGDIAYSNNGRFSKRVWYRANKKADKLRKK